MGRKKITANKEIPNWEPRRNGGCQQRQQGCKEGRSLNLTMAEGLTKTRKGEKSGDNRRKEKGPPCGTSRMLRKRGGGDSIRPSVKSRPKTPHRAPRKKTSRCAHSKTGTPSQATTEAWSEIVMVFFLQEEPRHLK